MGRMRRLIGLLKGSHLDVPREEAQFVWVLREDDFLREVLNALAGPATFCSLEGDLRGYRLQNVVSRAAVGALQRHTLLARPKQTFAVLPLDEQTVANLLGQLLADPNRKSHVDHIQIEKNGRLAMGGYDGLDFTWIGTSMSQAEFARLASEGILKPRDIDE